MDRWYHTLQDAHARCCWKSATCYDVLKSAKQEFGFHHGPASTWAQIFGIPIAYT